MVIINIIYKFQSTAGRCRDHHPLVLSSFIHLNITISVNLKHYVFIFYYLVTLSRSENQLCIRLSKSDSHSGLFWQVIVKKNKQKLTILYLSYGTKQDNGTNLTHIITHTFKRNAVL